MGLEDFLFRRQEQHTFSLVPDVAAREGELGTSNGERRPGRGYTCVLGCAYPDDPLRPPVKYIKWSMRLRGHDAPEVFAGEFDALGVAGDDVVEFDPFGVGFIAAHAEAIWGLRFE